MAEQIADTGYCAVKEQTAENTPVTPDVFIPLIGKDINTEVNLDDQLSIVGNRAARQATVRGQRTHQGSISCLAEPNTMLYLLSMLLKRGTVSGTGPYTWPFTLDKPTMPFTIDFAQGDVVCRFWDVQAQNMQPAFDANKMNVSMDISALGSFIVREVSSVSGTGPSTVTLKTNYDPSATKGLVAGDLITALDVSAGTAINATVTTVDNATDITCPEDLSGLEDGDLIYLRKQTPSINFLEPFNWARTEFRFGADAATALTATHTPAEQGSNWNLMFGFEDDAGAKRSGSFDPVALIKTLGDAEIPVRLYFDTPTSMNRFLTKADRALVIRCFSEAIGGTDTELRLTFNTVNWREKPISVAQGEIIYADGVLIPSYNDTDGQIFDVKVLNNLASL